MRRRVALAKSEPRWLLIASFLSEQSQGRCFLVLVRVMSEQAVIEYAVFDATAVKMLRHG